MITALVFLFWLIVGLLTLILVFICIPVHLKVRVRSEPALVASLELRLFSDRAPRLFLFESGRSVKQLKKANKEPDKAKPKKRNKRKLARRWATSLGLAELARAISDMLGEILSGVHLDRLRVQMEIGFGDPADTGRVFGQLIPLAYLPLSPAVTFELKPNFEKLCLKGDADAMFHFAPARLVLPAIRFAWKQYWRRS